MARIIDLALEVSRVLQSYSAVHEEILGSPIRRLASIARLRAPIDYVELEQRLAEFESELENIREELAALPAKELTKRAGGDIRTALDSYAQTLAAAICRLRVICRRIGEAERAGADRAAYDTDQLNLDKVAYDRAIQEYKRLGSSLNRLLSTF